MSYLNKCERITDLSGNELKPSHNLVIFIIAENNYIAHTVADLANLIKKQSPDNTEKSMFYLTDKIMIDESLRTNFGRRVNTMKLVMNKGKVKDNMGIEHEYYYTANPVDRSLIESKELSMFDSTEEGYDENICNYFDLIDKKISKHRNTVKNLIEEGKWDDYEFCLNAVKQDGKLIRFIDEQTPELCLLAVMHDPHAIEFIKNQTRELCLLAVRKDGLSIDRIRNQTEELCIEAVKEFGKALEYIRVQNVNICMEAVKKDYEALIYAKHITDEMEEEAVKQDGWLIRYVRKQTPNLCMLAVIECASVIQYIENQTEELCLIAVKKYGLALGCVKNKTLRICLEAVKQDGMALQFVENQTPEICLEAVKQNIDAFKYVKDRIKIISKKADEQYSEIQEFVQNFEHKNGPILQKYIEIPKMEIVLLRFINESLSDDEDKTFICPFCRCTGSKGKCFVCNNSSDYENLQYDDYVNEPMLWCDSCGARAFLDVDLDAFADLLEDSENTDNKYYVHLTSDIHAYKFPLKKVKRVRPSNLDYTSRVQLSDSQARKLLELNCFKYEQLSEEVIKKYDLYKIKEYGELEDKNVMNIALRCDSYDVMTPLIPYPENSEFDHDGIYLHCEVEDSTGKIENTYFWGD